MKIGWAWNGPILDKSSPHNATLHQNLCKIHIVWKLQKKSHSTLRAKRASYSFWVDKSSLKLPKIVNLASFWNSEACCQTVLPDRSTLIGTKIGAKCQNWKTQMRHFWWFSNSVTTMYGIVNGLKTSGWKKDVVMYRKRHFLNNGLLSSVTRRKSALAESRNNEACNEMTKSFRPITKRITKPQEKRRRSFRYFS